MGLIKRFSSSQLAFAGYQNRFQRSNSQSLRKSFQLGIYNQNLILNSGLTMSYEKAMEILNKGINEQSFEYFLSLTEEELNQLCQYLSEDHQKMILQYMERRQHIPSKRTRPGFVDSVRSAHSKIKFSEIESLKKPEEEESLKTLLRKPKPQPNENMFNYPFYGVIKRKMCTLLDSEPDSEAIKMMHSQLQSLFKQLVGDRLLNGLVDTLAIKRGTYLLQKNRKPLDVKCFRRFLSEIFRKEYRCFHRFMKKTAKATAGLEEENLKVIEKIQKETVNANQVIDEDDDQIQSDEGNRQQRQYFLRKTQNMSEEEFSKYADNRSLNFLVMGSEKLIRFVDSKGTVISRLKSKELLKLISYVLCRSLTQIVFRIITTKNKGVLEPVSGLTVTCDEVQHIGNDYVDRLRKRAKTYALKLPIYLQKAQQLFQSQFYEYGYDKMLTNETKFKLTKDESGNIQTKNQAQTVWKKNKACRKKWFERVEAEEQFRMQQLKKKPPQKYVNKYSEHLFAHPNQVRELGLREVFRQYFMQQETIPNSGPIIVQDIANMKMESLFK